MVFGVMRGQRLFLGGWGILFWLCFLPAYSADLKKPIPRKDAFWGIHLDLSGDYSPSNSVDRARLDARYLSSTGMPRDLMAWGFDKSKLSNWSIKPVAHLSQEAAVVLMQGGGFQIYHTPTRSGFVSPVITDQLTQIGNFCRQRQKLSHKSSSIPQTAILLSTESLWELSDALHSVGKEYDELQGALHALLELHYSADVLAEHQLKDRLALYSLVVEKGK